MPLIGWYGTGFHGVRLQVWHGGVPVVPDGTRAHLCNLPLTFGSAPACVRSPRGLYPPPTASPVRCPHRIGRHTSPSQSGASRASRRRFSSEAAARAGRDYVPVTERGAVVHALRQAREAFRDMRARLEAARDVARETYGTAREDGQGRVSAGLVALRAAVEKDRGTGRGAEDVRARLSRIVERDGGERERELGAEVEWDRDRVVPDGLESGGPRAERPDRGQAQERLRETPDRDRDGGTGEVAGERDGPSIRERLEAVLNKPRERLEVEEEREVEPEKERDREGERDTHREGPSRGLRQ